MKKFALHFLFVVSFAMVALIASSDALYASRSTAVNTRGGSRSVTYTVVSMDETYTVHAMAARDTFGTNAATLSQFAAAFPDRGTDTIVFTPQYFVTATWDPVGALVSQGRVVSGAPQPWLTFGAGFTDYNRFGIFDGELRGEQMVVRRTGEPPPYVTAFNPYPHLVINGERTTIEPLPGFDLAALNARLVRGFAGQRTDGSFLVGRANSTNLFELQDIAVELGLVNAVNLDGGASIGIWRSGSYVIAPGRQLPAVILITNNRPEGIQVTDPEPSVTHILLGNNKFELTYVRGANFAHINELHAMGFQIGLSEWTPQSVRMEMTWGEQTIIVNVGSRTATNNDEQYALNAAPFFMDGRQHMIMLPISGLFESLGYTLEWDEIEGVLMARAGT